MAMMGNHFFSKYQVPLIMAWMVYVYVVFDIQVDWRIGLGNRIDNMPLYQSNRFAPANPSTPPETHSFPTTILPVLIKRP